jgi:murein DD-endopeptidase MepM/ murein hydrolase activator NlpD
MKGSVVLDICFKVSTPFFLSGRPCFWTALGIFAQSPLVRVHRLVSLVLLVLLPALPAMASPSYEVSKIERVVAITEFFDSPAAALAVKELANIKPPNATPDKVYSVSAWSASTGELDYSSSIFDISYDYFDPATPGSSPADLGLLLPASRQFLLGFNGFDSLVCPTFSTVFSDSWGDPRPGGRVHVGTDLIAPINTPVVAVASGEVVRVDRVNSHIPGTDIDPGGLSVTYITSWGDVFYNGHFASIPPGISPGTKLLAGSIIGYVGETGNAISSVPHLHIQWHPQAGIPQNPYVWLDRICR